MGRRRGSSKVSLVRQIENAIKEIICIGQSKYEAKKEGQHTRGLYSFKHIQNTISVSIDFARFCREQYGITRIIYFKEEYYYAYLQYKEQEGVSHGHLMNIETCLRKLQIAMHKQAEKFQKDPVSFCSEKRVFSYNNPKNKKAPENRSMSLRDANRLIENIPSIHVRNAFQLQLYLGLRTREVINLTLEHFDLKNGVLKIKNGKGITKGGRRREIQIPERLQEKIYEIIKDKKLHEKVIPVKDNTLRAALLKAGRTTGIPTNGTHMFRHTFARERFKELLGESYEQGQKVLAYILKNHERGKRADYGIRQEFKTTYRQVQDAMNIVHEELGHGRGRVDLAQVYLKC
ncbi:tyrosine-type recombinase/integrase [Bacillus thuringiensis]|uniref:site-specific integrase n=1 Tax=Bacillus thuringiensis TaxID=1428 RepID=UPI000BFE65D8|nr:tyrosine-type recombinase/integrase [Bacillus thuringiensis]MED2879020.1 tyrosine-type recombinase/integrase [Bacillus thuringiensis]MYW26100.1 tyrosine-type recombinase/integrase [Bacillus thuringiensis]PGP42109.1 recombinase [Bacillus thuringiensis]